MIFPTIDQSDGISIADVCLGRKSKLICSRINTKASLASDCSFAALQMIANMEPDYWDQIFLGEYEAERMQ